MNLKHSKSTIHQEKNIYIKKKIGFSAYVFPTSFIVSGLTFRSLIHFQFIFMYGIRECSNFILLHAAVQVSSTTY